MQVYFIYSLGLRGVQVRALVHWVVSEFSGTHPLLSPGAGSLTHPQPAWMTEYTTSANQEAAGSSSANQAAAGGLRERLCKEVVAANVAAVTGAVEAAHGRCEHERADLNSALVFGFDCILFMGWLIDGLHE